MKAPLDYAPYELEAKKLLREVGELLKINKHAKAATTIDDIIVELRMMKAAVNSNIKNQ
jgi:hypothetical protein